MGQHCHLEEAWATGLQVAGLGDRVALPMPPDLGESQWFLGVGMSARVPGANLEHKA